MIDEYDVIECTVFPIDIPTGWDPQAAFLRILDLSDANRTLSQQYRFCAHLMQCEKRKINVYSSI